MIHENIVPSPIFAPENFTHLFIFFSSHLPAALVKGRQRERTAWVRGEAKP